MGSCCYGAGGGEELGILVVGFVDKAHNSKYHVVRFSSNIVMLFGIEIVPNCGDKYVS